MQGSILQASDLNALASAKIVCVVVFAMARGLFPLTRARPRHGKHNNTHNFAGLGFFDGRQRQAGSGGGGGGYKLEKSFGQISFPCCCVLVTPDTTPPHDAPWNRPARVFSLWMVGGGRGSG